MESATKSFFETLSGMQKQAVENFTEATEKFQKNLTQNNVMDSDFFKKWYDSQMSFFNQGNDKKNESSLNFFNQWMENQNNLAKEWMDHMQKSWTQAGNQNQQFQAGMDLFQNWMKNMNEAYSDMSRAFQPGSESGKTFEGMFNNVRTYMRMYEMWTPFMNAIKDKSFTPEMFKNMFNPEQFKGLMDQMFSMQPEYVKNYFQGFQKNWKENWEKVTEQGTEWMDQMKKMTTETDMNAYFNQMDSLYRNFYESMEASVAPAMKLVTPGTQKDQMIATKEMSNNLYLYNQVNARMQYMMYVTGLKATEEMATQVYARMTKGEDMSSFLSIYQEWLEVNDRHFVQLFDSEAYSKLQSELNSYGMQIKRAIDKQMERSMAHLPVINRTEMDELYLTIHELKKKINTLEKALKSEATMAEPKAEPKKAPAKKA